MVFHKTSWMEIDILTKEWTVSDPKNDRFGGSFQNPRPRLLPVPAQCAAEAGVGRRGSIFAAKDAARPVGGQASRRVNGIESPLL